MADQSYSITLLVRLTRRIFSVSIFGHDVYYKLNYTATEEVAKALQIDPIGSLRITFFRLDMPENSGISARGKSDDGFEVS